MLDRPLDLRSDTVTRPTPEMRAAIAAAEVGDDVFGDDPTMRLLQERIAAILGKEEALYVPSGTMSNLIAVRLHCRPGDELICEAGCHIYSYEQGGYAQVNGVAVRPVEGRSGVLEVGQLENLIRPNDPHMPRTRLVALENTHNRGGGKIQPYPTVEAICRWARSNRLATHLDGARLFNAVVATGIPADRWASQFDTVSVCFSKGLGAPVGSTLAGPRDLIREAVRHRKLFGGGMRQSGLLAAAALHALDHHIDRLADDHTNARRLADGIRQIPHLTLLTDPVETNILYFHVAPSHGTAQDYVCALRSRNLLLHPTGPSTIRAVTHLDVSREDVDAALAILAESRPRGGEIVN
jgi:threonine aldolase